MNLSRRELLGKYLGLDGSDLGPFAVLGLAPRDYSPANVDAALRRRLDELREHPEALSPEADQVRLALRKAADDLNDPTIRSVLGLAAAAPAPSAPRATEPTADARSLIMDRYETSRGAGRRPSGRSPAAGGTTKTGEHALESEARREHIARRREMIALATIGAVVLSIMGIFFTALVVLWPKAGPAGARASAGSNAATAGAIAGSGSDPTAGAQLPTSAPPAAATTPGPTAGAAAGEAPAAATPASASVGHATRAAEADTSSSPAAPPAEVGAARPVLAVGPRSGFLESALVIKRLRDSSKLGAAPEARAAALATFQQAHAVLRDWWCDYDPGANRAATESVVQALYALCDGSRSSPQAREALGAIISDARRLGERLGERAEVMPVDEVARCAWAIGLLSRLSRERDLPSDLAGDSAAALNDVLGAGRASSEPTFEAGAFAALRVSFPALVRSPASRLNTPQALVQAAIDRWLTCLDAVVVRESVASEGAILDALHTAMLNPREPEDDVVVYQAMEKLTLRLRWREDAPARARLIDFFEDERVSVGDLRVVTGLLAARSGAPGVDATMVLAMGAGEEQRSLLKRAYVQAWNLSPGNENDRLLDEWRSQVDERLADARTVRDPALRLYAAAVFARLNQAAHELWTGNTEAARTLLSEKDPEIPGAFTEPANLGRGGAAPGEYGGTALRPRGLAAPGQQQSLSGAWAEKFLSAERSIPLRLERLKELDAMPRPLSHADAQVLVEAACVGVPQQVQMAAQRIVARDTNDVAVLGAVLEMLPRSPRTRGVSQMIEKLTLAHLPLVTDPRWDSASRRAILGRLLSLMAASSTEAWQEQLAERIARSYLAQAGEEPSGTASEDALRAVRVVRTRWRQQADKSPFNPSWGMSIQLLDRRAEGRLSLSAGPVQAFAAEQTNLAETIAYVVAGERLTRAGGAAEALRELAELRRASTHVYEQVWASERAITRLWRLRLSQEARP